MLNIPEEVKALFSSDVVHKNFHVHFPGGEFRDLNNEDIVAESVSFTESLCSQQYFKFGLAEASQIEFTAVGIPNIRGAYIECAIEIDCDRLGLTWAAQHPVDDTLDWLEPQTCEYDNRIYYRIPYGRFRVDECPRNHGAMWQRQITAYSEEVHSNEQMSPFETYKLNMSLGNNKQYKPNLMRMIFADVGYYQPKILTRNGFTQTLVKAWDGDYNIENSFQVSCTGDTTLRIEYTYETKLLQNSDGLDKLYRLDVGEYDFAAFDTMMDALDHYRRQGSEQSVKEYLESIQFYPRAYFRHYPRYPWYPDRGIPDYDIRNGIPCFYPYRSTDGSLILQFMLYDTIKVTKITSVESTVLFDLDFRPSITTAAIYEWAKSETEPLDDVTLMFAPTAKKKMESVVDGKTYKYNGYSYSNAFSYTEIMTGFLELCGLFLKPDRDGTLNFFQMAENPDAIAINRSDWMEIWWDETPVESIGTVKIIYTQENDEQQLTVEIGNGNSLYIIEDNEVFVNAELDEPTARSILLTYFEPNASVVNFTPADIEIRGLPYLESGDFIELIAEDGTAVRTYILSQTISGIQHLEAAITSTNGELLEVIEDE